MNNIPITLDPAGNIEQPTFVLEYKNGKRIGSLHDVQDLSFENSLGNPSTFTFSVDKVNTPYYSEIKNFRLCWIPEWDKYYEINVDVNENSKKTKSVALTHLPEAEASQIMLFGYEINTEDDLEYGGDDYEGSTFYNQSDHKSSIIHRVLEKAVNFEILHVDESLASTENKPEFQFNGTSLFDALNDIANEYNCVFIFDSYTSEDGKIIRGISAYDLEDYCENPDCRHRDENMGQTCPECGGTKIHRGYGEDTTIFVSIDNIADEIGYTTDVGAVKNCFHLETGDEFMDAAVINANPNGTPYIWYISEELKEEMSEELRNAVNEYDVKYQMYYNDYDYLAEYAFTLSLTAINEAIEKYQDAEIGKLTTIEHEDGTTEQVYLGYDSVVGYVELSNLHYDIEDMQLYIQHTLMPSVNIDLNDTTSQLEASKLETYNWSTDEYGVSIQNLKDKLKTNANYFTTEAARIAVENAIKKKAATLIDTRYDVDVTTESLVASGNSSGTWRGTFLVENRSAPDDDFYPNADDTAAVVTIPINGDYEKFIKQCIDITLQKSEDEDYSTIGLFKMELAQFTAELEKYGIVPLENLQNICQSVLDILTQQGVSEAGKLFDNKDLYNQIYVPYLQKSNAIDDAINERQHSYDVLEDLLDVVKNIESQVHKELDFEYYVKSIDERLWSEFVSYRREDSYSNSNYSSEGLTNSELFKNARQFIKTAQKEIIKSSTMQHSINSTIKNLVAIEEFRPLLSRFAIGNWLRIEANDQIHKLRLLSYSISFNEYTSIGVTFSDVKKVGGYLSDLQSMKDNVQSMATSYSSIQRQTEKSSKTSDLVRGWVDDGLDATTMRIVNNATNENLVYDEHGVLIRQYDPLTLSYDPCQMKIVHSTIAITTDNWNSTKTAIGKYYYYNPVANEDGTHDLIEAYGINAETVVGKLILGQQLGIYNDSNSLTFDNNGLVVSNGTNTFVVDPNNNSLVSVYRGGIDGTRLLSVDDSGNLKITGDITATTLNATNGHIGAIDIYPTQLRTEKQTDEYLYITAIRNAESNNKVIEVTRRTNSDGTYTPQFYVNYNGYVWANNITAVSGAVGCWSMTESRMYDGSNSSYKAGVNKYGSGQAFWSGGTDLTGGSAPFRVGHNGKLFAADANIVGTINATSIKAKDKYYIYIQNFGEESIISADNWTMDASYTTFFVTYGIENKTGTISVNGSKHQGATNYETGISMGAYSITLNADFFSIYGNSGTTTPNVQIFANTFISGELNICDTANALRIVYGSYGFIIRNDGNNTYLMTTASGDPYGSWYRYITINNSSCSTSFPSYILVPNGQGVRTKNSTGTEAWLVGWRDDNRIYIGETITKATKIRIAQTCSNIGVLNSSGSWITITSGVSDIREKNSITDLEMSKDIIMGLKAKRFKYNDPDDDRYHLGFIAQDVRKVLDATIGDCAILEYNNLDPDEKIPVDINDEHTFTYTMRYNELIAPHISLTQDHEKRISALEKENEELKSIIKTLTK